MKKILLALFLACTFSVSVMAENAPVKQMPAEAEALMALVDAEADLKAVNKQLIKIENILKQDNVSIGKTLTYTKALNAVQDYATSKRIIQENNLAEAMQQLSALGEVPADGTAE
ncbi:MAG: hypothetical protein IJV75_07045, partial [Alphaproteobacteria bacterium]|nr:hypothetical protein [Alphaproteobacteria bacterium]